MHARKTIAVIAAVFCISVGAFASDEEDQARHFAREAAIYSEFEVETGKLAAEKSQDKDIKQFAQAVTDYHLKAAERLHIAMQSTNIDPTLAGGRLDDRRQELFKKLEGLTGDEFNLEYIKVQVSEHKEAVKLYGDYAGRKDAVSSLKEFAADMLPAIKDRLQDAKQLTP